MPKTAAALIREQLKKTCFFSGLTDTDYYQLSNLMVPRVFSAGDYAFREGEERAILFAVVNGSVAIEKQTGSEATTLATFGVGDALENAAALAATGRAPITGISPVSLPEFFQRGDGIRRAAAANTP